MGPLINNYNFSPVLTINKRLCLCNYDTCIHYSDFHNIGFHSTFQFLKIMVYVCIYVDISDISLS